MEKKDYKQHLKVFFSIIFIMLFSIFNFSTNINTSNKIYGFAKAETENNNVNEDTKLQNSFEKSQNDIQYSIFINNPTFSFVYNSNVYFIDSYDKNLKVFNTLTNEFYSKYVNLSDFGEIIDVTYVDGFIFAFVKKSENLNILKIDLNITNLNASLIFESTSPFSVNIKYSKISASKINDEIYLTLTPNYNNGLNLSHPLICKINTNENLISNTLQVILDENIQAKIKSSLSKIILASSNSSDYLNLIFVRDSGLISANIESISINSGSSLTLSDTNFERQIDSSNFDTNIYKSISVEHSNIYYLNNEKYLFLTYKATKKDDSILSYTKIYKLNISLFGTGSFFNVLYTFENPVTEFLTLSENYISYPSNQDINYIEFNDLDSEITKSAHKISNPNLLVKFFNEEDFVYAKTNKNIDLLSNPWNDSGIINMPNDSNIIIVGKGFVESQNLELEDYKYALFTSNNKNYLGYINVDNFTVKDEVSLDTLNSKVCKVVAKTALYSLPTKVLGDNITTSLKSSIIATISDNSRVEILDLLCDYKSNNSIFIKVKVNNEKVGYIETNQIQKRLDVTHYIVCNASIKLDGAKLYESESTDSEVIIELNKGTRIKITGAKNKKTGMTGVTFQDEYGNTFAGFIQSDYISSDGWSTMQIIGAILIAVNIAILILVVLYLKRRKEQANKKYAKNDFPELAQSSNDNQPNSNNKFE